MLSAGATLKDAMEAALAGDASHLRHARAAERRAVDDVVQAAAAQLRSAGLATGDQSRQRLESTLRAAVVDSTIADQLRAGTLDRDHDLPGFGMDSADLAAVEGRPGAPGAPLAAPPTSHRRGPSPRMLERKKELVDEADRLAAEADRLAAEAEAREAAATQAQAAARRARQAADRAVAHAATARQRADAFDVGEE